jgi:hypothetical protein
MVRCTKCVLPATIPNIRYDDRGVCNYCIEFEKNEKNSKIDFFKKIKPWKNFITQAKIQKHKNRSKYDVLVPLSGGRDSSYVALQLSKNLKILCVNYENPFASNQAKININRLIEKIGADLETYKIPNEIHEKSFKANLRAWLKNPELATTGLLCLACKQMYLEFYKIAKKENINLIVDGSNPNEANFFKLEAQAGAGEKKLYSIKSIMNISKKAMKGFAYIKPCNFIPGINTLLSLNGVTPYLRWKYPNITKIGYFYFHPYDENKINISLKNIGWKKADDNKSPWRFDCEINSLKNYLYKELIGANEKDELFSQNIRRGLMTREDAVKRLHEGDVNLDIVERVLKKNDMKLSDLKVLRKYDLD